MAVYHSDEIDVHRWELAELEKVVRVETVPNPGAREGRLAVAIAKRHGKNNLKAGLQMLSSSGVSERDLEPPKTLVQYLRLLWAETLRKKINSNQKNTVTTSVASARTKVES